MRELDSASPVIWPSWCYSGESQDLERGVGGAKKKSSTSASAMTTVEGGVKSERLSPSSSGGCAGGDTSSSRSGTPSSSCTPPRQGASPSQHLPLAARNYSDFMRSLAAKYNNNNPTDYLPRNGFTGLKSGTPPFPGLLPPPAAAAAPTGPKTDEKSSAENQAMLGFVPFPPVFSPVIDMNATQALLNMVRTHQQGAHLESYLKGASKRETLNAPLDLSSTAPPPKKHKRTLSESLYGSEVIPLLRGTGLKRAPPTSSVTGSAGSATVGGGRRSNKSSSATSSSPANSVSTAPCVSVCALKPCMPDTQTVGHWSVEDVAGFVASVDMCAEYAHNFREQRIDGSALPLLTEEHLTSTLGMKLGPALKLRSALSSRLGQCAVCLHCSHCHGGTTPPTTTTTVIGGPTSATTPNSTAGDK
uniref:Putative sterile alpha motif protein n=1 Tax=Triatoma infestans TaxID=30076 RepID=A0A023EZ39_TRIIF